MDCPEAQPSQVQSSQAEIQPKKSSNFVLTDEEDEQSTSILDNYEAPAPAESEVRGEKEKLTGNRGEKEKTTPIANDCIEVNIYLSISFSVYIYIYIKHAS